MPSLITIRNAIITRFESVPGIGRIHGFERYTSRMDDLVKLYVENEVLNGGFIRRVETISRAPYQGRRVDQVRWQARLYRGLSDQHASEIDFDETIENLRDAWAVDEYLGGLVASTVVNNELMSLEDSGSVMFAGVLCHSARLRFWTEIVL